jgi:hypothetical protein
MYVDPTCGGGSTAYVAEQCGRRWITSRFGPVGRPPLLFQILVAASQGWHTVLGDEMPAASDTTRQRVTARPYPHDTVRAPAIERPPGRGLPPPNLPPSEGLTAIPNAPFPYFKIIEFRVARGCLQLRNNAAEILAHSPKSYITVLTNPASNCIVKACSVHRWRPAVTRPRPEDEKGQ